MEAALFVPTSFDNVSPMYFGKNTDGDDALIISNTIPNIFLCFFFLFLSIVSFDAKNGQAVWHHNEAVKLLNYA